MKKIIILVLVAGIIWVGLTLFKTKVGDIRPSILPPAVNIKKRLAEEGRKRNLVETELGLKIAEGFQIGIFAPSTGSGQVHSLGKARDLEFSPGGTLLLSIPSQGRVVALPDKDQDGQADRVVDVLSGLDNPHGLAFFDGQLFVAEETALSRYRWNEENLTATKDRQLFKLPRGGRHTSRTIAFNKKGEMFVSVGSTCDTCFEKHPWLAAVIVSDSQGRNPRLFAKGLRNSVFIKVNQNTQELWGTEMGRDFLGDDLPSDEINIIKEGKDYGWPVCYGDKVYDEKFGQKTPGYCEQTTSPIYEIAAHSAPLGLVFVDSPKFPNDWQGDLLAAYHGSWNRSVPIGYQVVRLKVENNQIVGEEDFLSGFLTDSTAIGRPVDLEFSKEGDLYLSDDKAGVVYLITKK